MLNEYVDTDLIDTPFYTCPEYEHDVDKVCGVQDEVLLNMSMPATIQSSFKLFCCRPENAHFKRDPACFTRHVVIGLGHWCLAIELKNIDVDSFVCLVYHSNVSRFNRFVLALIDQDIFDPVLLFCNYKRLFIDVLETNDVNAIEMIDGEYRLRYGVAIDNDTSQMETPIASSIINAINYNYCNITNRYDPELPLTKSDRMNIMMSTISAFIMAAKQFNSLKHAGLKRANGHLLDFIASESGVYYTLKELESDEYKQKTYVIQAPLTSLFMSIPANCGTLYKKNGFE
ncbi:Hypothetical predicted protein [Olea europaea subsp. europaea]|uniref:Uncharacterized protein n=1 Tax=Olea europaea subsp. europaea TaxID=158383 RepID=A0A8S0TFX3_OLEEU|nr:Hypothetical predicted protein [Olea europaea subsp. europaea]